jgi:uncharacterized SAM-binding protein YcdF (DUF218 family)
LVLDDGPAAADIAVVLAGDYWGERITRAAELVRSGYVPAALVSGPDGFYGHSECDLAIPYAVGRGYPAQYFLAFPDHARSTRDEAEMILPELRRRGVHRMLLVTSDYHTRRAVHIFRAVARQTNTPIDIRVVAAPDKEFQPDSWWRTRQGQKIAFMEWSKTVATMIGL